MQSSDLLLGVLVVVAMIFVASCFLIFLWVVLRRGFVGCAVDKGESDQCDELDIFSRYRLLRERSLPKRITHLRKPIDEPMFTERVSAAAYIASYGVDAGLATKARLMWPSTYFSDQDVLRTASKVLSRVQVALLQELPPERLETISKRLFEGLDRRR